MKRLVALAAGVALATVGLAPAASAAGITVCPGGVTVVVAGVTVVDQSFECQHVELPPVG